MQSNNEIQKINTDSDKPKSRQHTVTKNASRKYKEWYKLDLSAVVYPTLQSRNFSSVYRLRAVMKECVDKDLLQKALDMSLERFPMFKVAMRTGMFWRYFETNNRPGPFVQEDIINPCMPMDFKSNNRYLIRLYYHDTSISLEAHHSLGDGNGGMVLFATILGTYLRLKGYEISYNQLVRRLDETPDPGEKEDAYMKYANAQVKPARPGDHAYQINGTKEPFYTLNIIVGTVKSDELAKVAKRYDASVTEYINAVLLYALLQHQKAHGLKKLKPVALAMPVNLRRFFPSVTLRNFITMVYPSVDPRLGEYSFEDIIKQVHHYMRYYINDKFLRGDITTNAETKRHPLIRIVPLFLKDHVVRNFYISVQDKSSTAGITNMGILGLPPEMSEHIEKVNICMGQPFSAKTNCSIISYNNLLTMTFASAIKESEVEMYFFQKLVKDGIHVNIESNRS